MQFDPEKTVFLIDGSSFLYRAYYSLQPLHTSNGEQVQAVYGFIRMLKKLADSFAMRYAVVAWDSKGPTTRHQIYSNYKATRQTPPHDLFMQKEHIEEFIALIKLQSIAKQGVEADDLLYSLALNFKQHHNTVVLVTSDKDMYQLLDDNVVMYDAMKNEFITKETFIVKKGYPVERVPLFYALTGDTSDNIPGVAGIGKVGATALAQQFASLDDLYAHTQDLKPRLQNALIANKDNAYLSLKLFTLHYYELSITKEECLFSSSQFKDAMPLYQKLEFNSLIKQFANLSINSKETAKSNNNSSTQSIVDETITLKEYWKGKNLHLVTTEEELKAICQNIAHAKKCAIDTETNGKHPLEATLIGVSLSIDGDNAYYIPCNHVTVEQQLSQATLFLHLNPILADASIKKYMHNAKFDLLVFSGQHITVKGLEADTMIEARLINPEWQKVGLKPLSGHYCKEQMLTFDQIVSEHKYKDFSEVPLSDATLYAATDARQTMKLAFLLNEELSKNNVLETYYKTIEHPLITILHGMEKEGVFFDAAYLHDLGIKINKSLEELEIEIKKYSNNDINLNSPRQIEHLLFKELGLPPQKKSTKGTAYSTDHSVLQTLAPLHRVPELLLDHRELSKIKNTYIDTLPGYINKKTGNIHTSFSQTMVATGRLSSSEPNLQNIPASGIGLEIREACKPTKGHVFISADYSQIELRVLAYLSQDQVLLEAFASEKDIHAQTASGIFGIAETAISQEQRQIGKKINFSILYGQGAYSLSKELRISHAEAKRYIDSYFTQYAGVKKWIHESIKKAEEQGYVTTHWGRRRYIANIHEKNTNLLKEAQRVAVNTIVQGTAADIVKLGMIRLHTALANNFPESAMILQIHDEIILTTPAETQSEVADLVSNCLQESYADWNIRFKVSIRIGKSWKETSK